MKKTLLLSLMASFLLLSSCATVFTPHSSKLTIYNGYPKNAEIFLNDELIGTAPLEIWVENEKFGKHNVVEIKSEGFDTAQINLDLKTDAGYFILDMVTIVGLGVDFYTGAIYKPKPSVIKYKLNKS